jgi:hypothetical protein
MNKHEYERFEMIKNYVFVGKNVGKSINIELCTKKGKKKNPFISRV